MAIWFWLAIASNAVVWSIFIYQLSLRRWNVAALTVGIFHMLFSVVLSVAPFRSFLDPNYPGLGLGFLRFDGMAATLPAILIFSWAVASAFISVAKGRARWMLAVMVGDLFLALNFGASTILEGHTDNWRIDLGEGRSITGFPAALALVLFFTLPFVVSAIWAARRSRSNGSSPPLTSDVNQKHDDTEGHPKDVNSLRFANPA